MLDFAGPLQAFHEANALGARYEVLHCGVERAATTIQGLALAQLAPLPKVGAGDLVFVPGFSVKDFRSPAPLVRWLKESAGSGARFCSVCTGAFVLGDARMLERRRCTTHWKRTAELQKKFPSARVLDDVLFVEDGPIMTSAGIAAGIDMALAILEAEHGPRLTAAVAREMVVYLRRDSGARQASVYLDYRTHLNPGVHTVQDWIVAHPGQKASLGALAKKANMSLRQLTRAFREATGISISEFRTSIHLEHARTLLRNPKMSIEAVAAECGFSDARQLRRLWQERFGGSPSEERPRRAIVGIGRNGARRS